MEHPAAPSRSSAHLVVRLVSALGFAGLTALAVFALAAQRGVVNKASATHTANQLARAYEDARFWVSQNESLERKYRVEPSATALADHEQAGRHLVADLHRVSALDPSAATKAMVTRLMVAHASYEQATSRMFRAIHSGEPKLSSYIDHNFTDPVFTTIEQAVFGGSLSATRRALAKDSQLKAGESFAFQAGLIAIILAVALVAVMSLVLRRSRKAGRKMRAAELRRLSALVVTDPLTELRNHRAFHEDLQRQLKRGAADGIPLALVLLDVDDLKSFNDSHGHQAGDERLRSVARAILATEGASRSAYRIGGDEFAVILPGAGGWDGFQFAQRLQLVLDEGDDLGVGVTAGVSETLAYRAKDEVIREADRALMSAKRSGQAVALFTPDMRPFEGSPEAEEDEHHIRTLSGALALAVDAKDPYTQSHSQTVSNLCAAIAAELGLTPARIGRVRIAGLLHDVGKIGIPDAILRKPAKLTVEEFEQMKTHAVLGESIVLAADMPERAGWVRHHHERIDGTGYPDGLAGQEIPLEARVIHVADAFEAMISDRPYRKAPGQAYAVEQMHLYAGTQFDERVVEALMQVLKSSTFAGQVEAPLAVG